MSYIEATREINSLVNKIKYREKRIAQQYREIHDMVSELEDFMGNATELIFRNKLILKRNDNSEILPIEIDVFSEAITYYYHEIIEKQLESISQRKQRIRELKLEIEELVNVNEALRRNKKVLENQIQKSNLQENSTDKTRTCLITSITFAVLLVIALLLTATLRESAVVLLFLGLSTVSFVWNSILVFEKQSLNNRKDEMTEKEFLFNKAIQTFENEKQLFEQEKMRLKGINETTIKTVNEKLQIARQQKEKYLTQEKEYQEKLAQLNEQFANLKEQIEAGEHAKRKAENLELDYKRLFEKYHNQESEVQTLQSDLNNSINENKRLSNKIASLGAEIENLQKKLEDCQKEKQELERTVNEKLQIARQQKEKTLTHEKQYQENLAQLNEQIANLKEQIEAEEHAKRKADILELDNKQLFEKYHNRESEIQTLKSDLNASTNENKCLSNIIVSLRADVENLQKQREDCQKEKQELERKCQYLRSHNASLENQNKDFQRQHEDSQSNYSELEIEYKRIQTKNQELERTVKKLNYQIPSLETKNEKLQSQLETIQSKYSDLDNRIKLVQKEKQELENEKRILNSQKKSLESEKEKLQKQNNDLQSKNTSFNDKYESVLEENQELQNENYELDSQISSLEIEKEELLTENADYVIENSKLKVQIQNLQEECLSLRNEKLDYNSNKKDYLDLLAKFNALQKENEELRYYNSKIESKKSQEIIRRNCSDDEFDNSSQSVPAEIEPVTPTIDNSANSEQDLYYEIADEIIKKASYSKEELIALYRRFNMSIFSGNAKINTWTDDVFGDHLIFEENKRFVIDPDIAAKVRNSEVENE